MYASVAEDAVSLGHGYQGLGDVAAVRRDSYTAHYYFRKSQVQFEFEGAEATCALVGLEARLERLEAEAVRGCLEPKR